jgi:hypothetical protein
MEPRVRLATHTVVGLLCLSKGLPMTVRRNGTHNHGNHLLNLRFWSIVDILPVWIHLSGCVLLGLTHTHLGFVGWPLYTRGRVRAVKCVCL